MTLQQLRYIVAIAEAGTLSGAAKALFIHRNTMLNKIHKIEEIIDSSLDDPKLRERLLFSCRVIEYMSRYCHEDILVLKRNLEKGKTGPV